MAYGITAVGITPKTLEVIQGEIIADYRASIGQVNVENDSVLSQIVRPVAEQMAEIWQACVAVYQSASPNGAAGAALDAILAQNFIERLGATKTRVVAAITGDLGTVIPAGTLASIGNSENVFSAIEDATIDLGSCLRARIGIGSVLNSTVYYVTINSVVYDITSDGSATEDEIVTALVADLAGASSVASVENNGDGTFTILSADLETTFEIAVSSNLSIVLIASPQTYDAVDAGPISCPAGTLDTITTPVAGLDSISNLLDGVLGRSIESDNAARMRRLNAISILGSGTLDAIKANLLDTPGVTSVFPYENTTDAVDVSGRPPHSIEIVVAGGADEDIARAIHQKRAAGINTYGNVNGGAGITFEDDQGFDQTIMFSRPVERFAWISVEYSLYSEEDFPVDGESQIASNILAYGIENFSIGKDFILQRFVGPSMIPGVASVAIQIAVTTTAGGTPSYGTSNIAVGQTQVLVFDSGRITVAEA